MPEPMGYDIDDSRWPLLVARATVHLSDPEATDRSYRKLESLLQRDQKFLIVFDMRGATSTSSRRRKFMAWCEQHASTLTRLLVAGAVVAATSVERGFVTAGLWVRTPPFPMRVFSSQQQAEEWLLSNYAHLTS